jgi:uncharacterized membrane protein YdbT with pleckstrin-like domain
MSGPDDSPTGRTRAEISTDGGYTASDTSRSFPLPDARWFQDEVMPDETVIIAGHPSVVVSMPSYLFGGAVSLVGMVLTVSYLTGYLSQVLGSAPPATLLPIGALFVLGGIGFAVWEHITRTNTWYIVTDQQVIEKHGVFNANTDPIDFASVTEIEVDRPFYLRPFGIGHIRVYAASTAGADLVLPSVPNVGMMAKTLKREKRKHRGTDATGV